MYTQICDHTLRNTVHEISITAKSKVVFDHYHYLTLFSKLQSKKKKVEAKIFCLLFADVMIVLPGKANEINYVRKFQQLINNYRSIIAFSPTSHTRLLENILENTTH